MRKKTKRLTPLQLGIFLVLAVIFVLARLVFPGFNKASLENNSSPSSDSKATTPPLFIPGQSTVTQANQTAAAQWLPSSLPFDYFVLSLSWAPEYCASNGNQDQQECGLGKNRGFVLHGLWPENNHGYPSHCSNQKLDPSDTVQFSGLFANDSLIEHEWETHGTCSGLPSRQYFLLAQQLKQSIVIPNRYQSPSNAFRNTTDGLVNEFVSANSGLSNTSIAVNCSAPGRYLNELRVCFTRDGKPTACGMDVVKNMGQSCGNSDFLIRNTN